MEVTIVDYQFIRGMLKTTVSLLLIGIVGLLSPKAMAQKEVLSTEGTVQRLEEVPIPKGTIQQLEGFENKTSSESPWSVGGNLNDDSENDSFSLDLGYTFNEGNKPPFNYDPKFDVWNLGLKVYPTGENWLSLNQGLAPRGYVAIPLIRF